MVLHNHQSPHKVAQSEVRKIHYFLHMNYEALTIGLSFFFHLQSPFYPSSDHSEGVEPQGDLVFPLGSERICTSLSQSLKEQEMQLLGRRSR